MDSAASSVYMHPNTYAIYADDSSTPSGGTLTYREMVQDGAAADVIADLSMRSSSFGDGTVPAASAAPFNAFPAIVETFRVSGGIDHQSLPAAPATIDYLLQTIPKLFGGT